MVSMKDISKVCGVSVATVSKALNDHSDIGEETKHYIRKMAKEMGYFPNSSARTLKTKRSNNLGLLFVEKSQSGLTHDYFISVLDSIKDTAEARGYDITFISGSEQRKDKMTYLEHSRYRGIDGAVIACVDFDSQEVRELAASEIPVVTIDHVLNNKMAIVSDNVLGMKELFNYIYEQGHRKIAYIHGGDESAVTRTRLACFYKEAEERGLVIPEEYIKMADYRNTELTAQMTYELLDLPEPPTCILYPDDFAALGGFNAIRARGLRIPEDISIAGYDGIKLMQCIEPKLTTIKQDTKKIGQYAIEKLLALIEKPRTTLIEQVRVPVRLEKGESVRKI